MVQKSEHYLKATDQLTCIINRKLNPYSAEFLKLYYLL